MSAKKKAASKRGKAPKAAKAPKRVTKQAKSAKKAMAAKRPVARKAVAAKKPVAKKVAAKAPKKAAKAKVIVAKPSAKAKPAKASTIKRRDGAGHLDPKYEADLRARGRTRLQKDDRAFASDALSEELGEEFVETITSGEDEGNQVRDERVTEELGGPFTLTTGGTEFAEGVDGSNPKRATREPFPRT